MDDDRGEPTADDCVFEGDHKQILQRPAVERPRRAVPQNSSATDWAYRVPILRAVQRSLLLVLARRADRFGCSWCSQKTLAAEAGCCDRTVRTVLKGFENRGLIRRIGRMGPQGGQLTDVVVLTGWPTRQLIPVIGHPRLGQWVKETLQTRIQWREHRVRARSELPRGAEATPDKQSIISINTTTAQADRVLSAAFDALGSWATTENMQNLADDLRTLQKWIEQGVDLELHILPVLAEKARTKSEIPLLRTWRYFEIPIGKAASRGGSSKRSGKRQAAEPISRSPTSVMSGSCKASKDGVA